MAKSRKAVDHTEDGRMERAKGRSKGMFLVLLAAAESTGGCDTFAVIADENAALENDADVVKWMEENNHVGTVWPVRFMRGKESGRRFITRSEQRTFKTIVG